MSATQRTTKRESEVALPPAQPAQVDPAYQSLLDQLREVERKYKLGDVDEELASTQPNGGVRWAFEEKLDQLQIMVQKYKTQLLQECPSRYYKFLAIHAEAKDYFDTATASYRLDLHLLALDLYRKLPKQVTWPNNGEETEEHRTLKNMVRVIVSGLEYLLTTGDFGIAISYAEGLLRFVSDSGLATKANPANGTRAVIYYFLGRTLRQRGIEEDCQQAIDYFYQCSELYFEMAQRRGNQDIDVIYARTRAMVSLAFGAGFLFYNAQSDLRGAKALVAQARLAFLKDDGTLCCKLHYYYLELLYATILRAEAGEITEENLEGDLLRQTERTLALEKLRQASEIVDDCALALENKPKVYIHVLYNRSLIYLYQGSEHYDAARACLAELLQRCQDKPAWVANALILKSHLERRVGDSDSALNDAIKAYNQADNHLAIRIEALLARGQAQVGRNQLPAARADFEKALQLNSDANLKLTVMAQLLLVDLALIQLKPQEAYERFAHVETLIPSIRHGYILNRYHELKTKIDNLHTDFTIKGKTEELDYKKYETDLQRWLLEKAAREDSNLTRIAQRLNVSKKTVYSWLLKYKIRI